MPKVKISGLDVEFPHKPYSVQIKYMEKAIEAMTTKQFAILESPTGTGKTLSLLCSALAFVANRKKVMPNSVPRIIYASRTHSQIQQVVKELKTTSYNPKISVIASRKQLCINKIALQSKFGVRDACRSLVNGRMCKYKQKVDELPEDSFSESLPLMDIEELKLHGSNLGHCPYYFAREEAKNSGTEIIFMPYNYLIDSSVRRNIQLQWQDSIIIIDEAHNIEAVCEEAASFDLTAANLAAAISEVDEYIERRTESSKGLDDDEENQLLFVKKVLLNLEQEINEVQFVSKEYGDGYTGEGAYILELFNKVELDPTRAKLVMDTLQKITNSKHTSNNLEHFSTSLAKVFTDKVTPIHLLRQHCNEFYKVYITETRTSSPADASKPAGRTLQFMCLSPSVAFHKLCNLNVATVILTSGTLTPLSSFSASLRKQFPILLENEHVIERKQVWIGGVNTGPNDKVLNSNYKNRDTVEYKDELGKSVLKYAKVVPQGMLVFFPSYNIMYRCIKHWQMNGTYRKIQSVKSQLVEPRKAEEMSKVTNDFTRQVKSKKGALLYCVCRGKISEGIDFADEKCRAVIVTGLPFPPLMDPKIVLKKQYLNSQMNNRSNGPGQIWYMQQASRAVNQAVGRVIRHQNDFGAIVLLDEKFSQPMQKHGLSAWLRSKHHVAHNFKASVMELSSFFKSNSLIQQSEETSMKVYPNSHTKRRMILSAQSGKMHTKPRRVEVDWKQRITPIDSVPSSCVVKTKPASGLFEIGSVFKTLAPMTAKSKVVRRNGVLGGGDDVFSQLGISGGDVGDRTSVGFMKKCKGILSRSNYLAFEKLIPELNELSKVKGNSARKSAKIEEIGRLLSGPKGVVLRKEFYMFIPNNLKPRFKSQLINEEIVSID